MKLRLLLALLPSLAMARSVQQSIKQLGTTGSYSVTFMWTAEESGKIPVTEAKLDSIPASEQGYQILQVEAAPETPAPSDGYSVQIVDSLGADILDGRMGSLSATTPRAFRTDSGTPFVYGEFSLKVTGNSNAGARGTVVVYFRPAAPAAPHGNSFDVSSFDFSQTIGGMLTGGIPIGVELSPCPAGVSGSDGSHYLYLSGDAGTDEAVLITGGSCTSGATSGTVVFTPANDHEGEWRLSSATFGLQEAINAAGAAGGGTVLIGPGSHLLLAPVTVLSNNLTIQGAGGMCCGLGTWIHRTGDFGDSLAIGSPTVQANAINLFDFTLSQDLDYVSGNPGHISNRPTSGANIRVWGTNTINIQRLRLENMVHNLVLTGGAHATVRDCQFFGLWDGTAASLQVTKASVLINETISGTGAGLPTYVSLVNDIFLGYPTETTPYGAGPRQHVEIDACEDCYIDGGSMGVGNVNNILIQGTSPYPLLNVRIRNVKFDSAGTADLQVATDGIQPVADLIVTDNIFDGELVGTTAISVPNLGSGSPAVEGLVLSNNQFFAYLATPITILDGAGFTISGNSIRFYNAKDDYSDPAGSSGIYFGGRSSRSLVTGNFVGGGASYEDFGTGSNYCNYAISLENPAGAQQTIRLEGNESRLARARGNILTWFTRLGRPHILGIR
jgi:hypothetical protein